MALFDRSAEELTGNRMRERVSDTQQGDLSRESNPGQLQEASVHGALENIFFLQFQQLKKPRIQIYRLMGKYMEAHLNTETIKNSNMSGIYVINCASVSVMISSTKVHSHDSLTASSAR